MNAHLMQSSIDRTRPSHQYLLDRLKDLKWVLYNQETGDLLSGDTLVSDFGCPRANLSLFTPDCDRLVDSALNLMALEPKYIHPGHGKPLPLLAYAKAKEQLIAKLR